MKFFTICQVADLLSESLLTMFVSPNEKYSRTYFTKYAESSLKGCDPADIVLIEYDSCCVYDSFSEFLSDFKEESDVEIIAKFTLLSEVLPDEG